MDGDWRWEERLPQLVGCLLRDGLTLSEAEEAAQEAAAALLARWDEVAPEGRFVWLLTVARNSWRRERRRAALERKSVQRLARCLRERDVEEEVEGRRETGERLRRTVEALGRLPLRRRLVLWLRASGLRGDEVGRALGQRPGLARLEMHRGRRRLRELLEITEVTQVAETL